MHYNNKKEWCLKVFFKAFSDVTFGLERFVQCVNQLRGWFPVII